MKKQFLLLVLMASVSGAKGMAYPQPIQFKEIVMTLRSSGDIGVTVHRGLVNAYKQVISILKSTEQMCIDGMSADQVRANFKKPGQDFVNSLKGRMNQFKATNAEHLITPLIAVLADVLSDGGDFKYKVSHAIKQLEKYVAVIA